MHGTDWSHAEVAEMTWKDPKVLLDCCRERPDVQSLNLKET